MRSMAFISDVPRAQAWIQDRVMSSVRSCVQTPPSANFFGLVWSVESPSPVYSIFS